jgi:DeoR/GlpR family transcriptional regulator of sugar metabolism
MSELPGRIRTSHGAPDAGTPSRAPDGLLVAQRLRKISQWLGELGSVRVADLARRVKVSEETIRRDLRALAAAGIAETVHGGAILVERSDQPRALVPPVDLRASVQHQAKTAIGEAAAAHVRDGQVVIVDGGTTTLAVAEALRCRRDLTVVTNSLTVAQVAAGLPGAKTHVIGGRLVNASLTTIGPKAQRDLAPVRADWAFLGAAAIDVTGGFTSADPYEAEIKRAMIRAARSIAIVADHTKFDSRRFASFAEARDIHYVFTTAGLTAEVRRWLQAADVRIVICDAPAAGSARKKR